MKQLSVNIKLEPMEDEETEIIKILRDLADKFEKREHHKVEKIIDSSGNHIGWSWVYNSKFFGDHP